VLGIEHLSKQIIPHSRCNEFADEFGNAHVSE
jgi:hypothetical protein